MEAASYGETARTRPYTKNRKKTSALIEKVSDDIEKQFGNSDGPLEETLNLNVDTYLKRNKDLEGGLLAKERDNIYVDKENVQLLDQSRKVTFAKDVLSPKRNARRRCTIAFRPPVEL